MPTNLPPAYFAAEERFRTSPVTEERIAALEEMYSLVPKHKGTEKLRADLKRRLSELRSAPPGRKGGPSRQVSVYQIEREGAGQVVVIGPPNSGKSAFVRSVTNAKPEVAASPFTTWTPTPGMMEVKKVQIQLIDTPPLNEEYVDPEFLALVRRSDVVLLMVDLQAYPLEQIEDAVAMLEEAHIASRHRREQYEEQFRWAFVPFIVVANKVDDAWMDEDFEVLRELLGEAWSPIPVSVETGRNIDLLKEAIYDTLGIIRVYSKRPGKEPDLDAPFVMKAGGTVEEFAGKIHRDFLETLESARVWGTGVYDGQMVGREHVLHDGDVVELRT